MRKFLYLFVGCMVSCTTPFEIQTENYEGLLVVNTTITDEKKRQEIVLSRAFELEEELPEKEIQANIVITNKSGTVYPFEELSPGIYTSKDEFGIEQEQEYQLNITTQNGEAYLSDWELTPPKSVIEKLYAKRKTNDRDQVGVGFFVDARIDNGASFFRYEFEEGYKIKADYWLGLDLLVPPYIPHPYLEDEVVLNLGVRSMDKRFCYTETPISNTIILHNSQNISNDLLVGSEVNFINAKDRRVAFRYSTKVFQYVQNQNAFEYYRLLKEFSSIENLFTQVQTGHIPTNIRSVKDSKKVLGFFELVTKDTQRTFVNHDDLFPDISRFEQECFTIETDDPSYNVEILSRDTDRVILWRLVDGDSPEFIKKACGDCTVDGNSKAPNYWIE